MHYQFRRLLGALAFTLVLGACASSAPKSVNQSSGPGAGIENLVIGYKERLPDGYYVVIDKSSGLWRVTDLSRSPITRRPNQQSEILYFNERLSYAQPAFEKVKHFNGVSFECTPISDDKAAYTPCTSDLMATNVGMSVGKNVFAAALTFGLAAGYHVAVDRQKVAAAIKQSGALQRLQRSRGDLDAAYQYEVAAQQQRERLELQEAARREQEARQRELASRRAMLPQILQIGATICQDRESGHRSIRYTGFVERIAGERIQIRVAFAGYPGSSLTPGGFQPHIIWDDAVNWYPCS